MPIYRAEALHGSSSVEVVVPEHLPLERGAEQRAEQCEASLVVDIEGARRALGARGRRLGQPHPATGRAFLNPESALTTLLYCSHPNRAYPLAAAKPHCAQSLNSCWCQ